MTKSTITREQLLEIIETDHVQCGEASYLARMALAAMDSEPVIVVGDDGGDALSYRRLIQSFEPGTKLYRHAQTAPEKYNIGDATMRHIFTPTGMTNVSDMQAVFDRVEAVLVGMDQPAPVVPDEVTAEDCPALVKYDVTEVDEAWSRGFNACRAAMLQAQPQNAPQNIPEIIPDCWCRTCRPVTLNDMRFVVCPDCGNKRCPRANDHRNSCTGSNEPGQEGSAYPAAPQEVPDGK